MEISVQKVPSAKTLNRRAVLSTGLGAVLALVFDCPAQAKRRRRRRGRNRVLRRRAIRRFRRRSGGRLEKRARRAIQQGEIRPLREVMAKVRRRSNAEVLDVDLHKRADGWVYALRILTVRGRVRDVFLDARTLELLRLADEGGADGVPLPPDLMTPPRAPLQPGLQEPGREQLPALPRPPRPPKPESPPLPAPPRSPLDRFK